MALGSILFVSWLFQGRCIVESLHRVGAPHPGFLYQFKYRVDVSGPIIVQKYGLSLEQCFTECFYRSRCHSFKFRRRFGACELNFIDSTWLQDTAESRGYVFSQKMNWNSSLLPAKCKLCQENERCVPTTVDDVCIKKECAPPELTADEHLLGNLFSVGNTYKVINDKTNDENMFTCSLLPDVGTTLSEGCIYSCAIQHSECQKGVCVCSSGYSRISDRCYKATCGGTNIAYGKTVSMSSIYDVDMSMGSNAVDGGTSGNYNDGSCAKTQHDINPWIMVDLGTVYSICRIQLFARLDCCNARLRNLHVYIGSSPNELTVVYTRPAGNVGATLDIGFDEYYTGRFIKFQLAETEYLTLCEIEVYEVAAVDCKDIRQKGFTNSGVYTVTTSGKNEQFDAYCDMSTPDEAWLVFQRRQDGSIDFYKEWSKYEAGFGDVTGEFWLGNRRINALTSQGQYQLRIDMEDFEGNKRYAQYTSFNLGDAADNYRLTVSGYIGDAGDSFGQHNGAEFSTFDHDRDTLEDGSCAIMFKGGWWYKRCHRSNLNGLYLAGWHNDTYAKGVNWYIWTGYFYSLKKTEMKIRRLE